MFIVIYISIDSWSKHTHFLLQIKLDKASKMIAEPVKVMKMMF